MLDHTEAACAAISVAGVDRADIRHGGAGGLAGTVHHRELDINYDVRLDPDGQGNVNGQRDFRDADLAVALTAAITADQPADETARILAQGGDPVKIATYAIHEAHRRFAEATAGPVGRERSPAARAARRTELAAALAGFDAARPPGPEPFVIIQARIYVAPPTPADLVLAAALGIPYH